MQGLRQNGDEGGAHLGGQEVGDLFCLFPFHQPGGNQLLQNPGAGGWGANALPLRIVRHIPSPGVLHAGEDGIFREMLGRGRFALLDVNGLHCQRHSFGQSVRQGGVLGRLPVCVGSPAHIQHDLPLGSEAVTGALHRHGGLGIPIGRTDRPEQGQRHQLQDLPLP